MTEVSGLDSTWPEKMQNSRVVLFEFELGLLASLLARAVGWQGDLPGARLCLMFTNKMKCQTLNLLHTLNSSANICLLSGDGYTARPWGRSLFLPTDFFTNTVSPRPPSSVRKERWQKRIFRNADKHLTADIHAKLHGFSHFWRHSLGTVWVRMSSIFSLGACLVSSTNL